MANQFSNAFSRAFAVSGGVSPQGNVSFSIQGIKNMIVPTAALNLAILNLIKATGGPLNGSFMGYYVNTVALNGDTVLSDLHEGNSGTYARQAPAFGAPSDNGSDSYKSVGAALHWAGDVAFPETAQGVFLASALTGGNLILAEALDSPVALETSEDALDVVPTVVIGLGTNYGSVTVID